MAPRRPTRRCNPADGSFNGHNLSLIIVTALSIGEFQFSNLVSGFLNRTYPVVLLQAFYGATGFACAATVILLTLALTASITGAWSARGAARISAPNG